MTLEIQEGWMRFMLFWKGMCLLSSPAQSLDKDSSDEDWITTRNDNNLAGWENDWLCGPAREASSTFSSPTAYCALA